MENKMLFNYVEKRHSREAIFCLTSLITHKKLEITVVLLGLSQLDSMPYSKVSESCTECIVYV
jgi:hypothetical protein